MMKLDQDYTIGSGMSQIGWIAVIHLQGGPSRQFACNPFGLVQSCQSDAIICSYAIPLQFNLIAWELGIVSGFVRLSVDLQDCDGIALNLQSQQNPLRLPGFLVDCALNSWK